MRGERGDRREVGCKHWSEYLYHNIFLSFWSFFVIFNFDFILYVLFFLLFLRRPQETKFIQKLLIIIGYYCLNLKRQNNS